MQLSADRVDEIEEDRVKIGWVIVTSYIAILLIHIGILFFDIAVSIFQCYRNRKNKKQK
jgi:hypothetical protein